MTIPHALHSSDDPCWETPDAILEPTRTVFGGRIDLDVASSVISNIRVRAERFYQDSLGRAWNCADCSVFCNPPGGLQGRDSLPALFWRDLVAHRGYFSHAIYVGFTLNVLQTTQRYTPGGCGAFPHCIPSRRLRFVSPHTGLPGTRPAHPNVIVYVPGRIDRTLEFVAAFAHLGLVR